MKEYKIQFTKQKLNLFKTTKEIKSLLKKTNYIECDVRNNQENFSLLKEREMNYQSKISAYGSKANKLFVGRIIHSQRLILLSEVENIYRFNNKLETKGNNIKNTNLAIKNVSKEELEHRRKNINYILRKINNEEGQKMRYVKDENIDFDIEEITPDIQEKHILDEHFKIRKTIFQARIVNFDELNKIYQNSELILQIIGEMCFKLNGRFVLKNKFYEPFLRKKRARIIEKLKHQEILTPNDLDKHEKFLILEICELKDCKYNLKGHFEGLELPTNRINLSHLFKDNPLMNMNALINKTGMEEDELIELINNNESVIKLHNNTYVFKGEEKCEIRDAIIDLLTIKSIVKRNDVFKHVLDKTGKELNIFLYNKVMKEFCIIKGHNWVIKDGD